MSRFVRLNDVVAEMAKYAPPAWCKLAILGALHTEKVYLFAAEGNLSAYIPPFYLRGDDDLRPKLIRRGRNTEDLIDQYDLQNVPRPNTENVVVYGDKWSGELKRIAIGWLVFSEPWDWKDPLLQCELFEIPEGVGDMFAYDDLHHESEPDDNLYFDATFRALAMQLEDAESIVPMANFDQVAFANSGEVGRKTGRPKGTGYAAADESIVEKMVAEFRSDPSKPVRKIAEGYAEQAVGHGTLDSKIKRLERRLRELL